MRVDRMYFNFIDKMSIQHKLFLLYAKGDQDAVKDRSIKLIFISNSQNSL
jgi:hypothetical protein